MNHISKKFGFTIVELIVSIVVIGVLAAISLISYNGISQKATTASVLSDLSNASKQLGVFNVENSNYPQTIDCERADDETNKCLKSSPGTVFVYTVDNISKPKTYSLVAKNGNITYFITQDSKPQTPVGLASIGDISGIVKAGLTLTAGSILPSGSTVTYQWMSSDAINGVYSNISGATSSTYVLKSVDIGKYIKVIVTGINAFSGTVISNATSAVQANSYQVEVLLVGGGGGGGAAYYGGGGGGGQFLLTTRDLNVGSVSVVIGLGGGLNIRGVAGGTTSFGSLIAVGGGGGGGGSTSGSNTAYYPGGSGASGGGAAEQNTGGTGTAGFNGGSGGLSAWAGNGGGGSGGIGGYVPSAGRGGSGGVGLSSDISGSLLWYSGGGGGGGRDYIGTGGSGVGGNGAYSSIAAVAGMTNRGGGGGGARLGSGAVGGSGVVVVRYLIGTVNATGGSITTIGGYTIHTFTSNGTFTVL